MTSNFLDCVLRGAEAMAARDPVGTLADPDLLRRFASDRDQAAFAVLVRRHGPLVWGVCRNLLPGDADAEDAFQATFLALVRSASTVRQTGALGGWLHGVAYRVAMKARRSAARRKSREARVAMPEPNSPVSDAAWDELQVAVHEEVCRLPEKLRVPFVLCGLQGRAQKDAAQELGWKIGTLSGRLTQARQRLLDRLARRGVPVGVAVGAAVLSATCGNASAPASIIAKVRSATAMPDAVSPVVNSLARGVSQMYMTRTKLLVAGVLIAGALGTGIGSHLMSKADAQPPSDADSVKKAIEHLRASQQAQTRWEYKFVPVERPLSTADLQKVLGVADQEGWHYCGSQDLLTSDKAKEPKAHMVFKRPRGATTADGVRYTAAQALLEGIAKNEAEVARAADASARAKEQTTIEKYEKAFRAQAEHAAAVQAAARNAAANERLRAEELAVTIQAARKQQEDLLLKIKELEAGRQEDGMRKASGPDSLTITLKHVTADDAVKMLAKVSPALKVASVDQRTNSITLVVTEGSSAKIKELFASQIDVAPGKPMATSFDKPEAMVIALKHTNAVDVSAMLNKLFDKAKEKPTIVAEPMSNSVIVLGSTAALADVKKLVAGMDVAGKGK